LKTQWEDGQRRFFKIIIRLHIRDMWLIEYFIIKKEEVVKTYRPSTLKDIKKMFASEHVAVNNTVFGTEYIDKRTGKKMQKSKAIKILNGDY
jgi:hypothetical protein